MFKFSSEYTGAIYLVVTIEDTGMGIHEDVQNRIFMPFMQADSSTSQTYGGTGIGLSISKYLVDLMGGEIGFVSKPGIGSTFSFIAVFSGGQKNSVDQKRRQSDPTVSDFQGMRALVIDGRITRAEITKYHLRRLGVHVEISIDPKSALSLILEASKPSGKNHFDMVLVNKDAWGEGSGLAFPPPLIELRQSDGLKPQESLPKMLLLAKSLSSSEVDYLKMAGYADSIIKPLRERCIGILGPATTSCQRICSKDYHTSMYCCRRNFSKFKGSHRERELPAFHQSLDNNLYMLPSTPRFPSFFSVELWECNGCLIHIEKGSSGVHGYKWCYRSSAALLTARAGARDPSAIPSICRISATLQCHAGSENSDAGLASVLESMEFRLKLRCSEASILEDFSKAINLVHTRRGLVDNDRALLNQAYRVQQDFERWPVIV